MGESINSPNARRKRFWYYTLIFVVILCISLFMMLGGGSSESKPNKTPHTETKPKKIRSNKLIYLVMAQDKTHAQKFIDVVPVEGRVDLSILTWKEPILEELPSTIKSFHQPKTSYNEGRNLLLKHAIEREKKEEKEYLYFIFLDDDAYLKCNCNLKPFEITDSPPSNCTIQDPRTCWDEYENFLYEWEPAVGVPFIWFGTNRWVEERDVTGAYFHDPMFEGMHREIVEFLLPYSTRYDKTAWMGGTLEHIHKSSIFFKNHKIQLNYVQVINPEHRDYPKTSIDPIVNADVVPCLSPALNASFHHDFFKVAEDPWGYAKKKPEGLNYRDMIPKFVPPQTEICLDFWRQKPDGELNY